MLAVVVGVEVGQLDGVLDGLDLGGEPADVLVVDVGHFLERQVFDFALRQLLQEVAALAVHEDMIADLELDGAEWVSHDTHLVLVGAEGDYRSALLQHLLENDHIALNFVARHLDHVEPLVEHELLTRLESLRLDRGMQVDLHLATLGQDVDGRVLVEGEIDAVRGGRSAQLVNFLFERGDLLPRLVESIHELLVLIEGLHELTIGLAQLVFQHHELLWSVFELLAQASRLSLERMHVGLKILDLDLVLGQPAAVVRIRHRQEFRQAFHPLGRCLPARSLFLELLHVRPFLSG